MGHFKVTAALPEPLEHVVEGPGHDEGVVEGHHGGYGQDAVPQPLHDGGEPGEDLGAGGARVLARPIRGEYCGHVTSCRAVIGHLAQQHLHEVEREAAEHQAHQVGEEEGAAAVLVADVREPGHED